MLPVQELVMFIEDSLRILSQKRMKSVMAIIWAGYVVG